MANCRKNVKEDLALIHRNLLTDQDKQFPVG